MEPDLFEKRSDYEWVIPRRGAMRVPAVIFATEALVRDMDQKVYEQAVNVATLPGIVKASYAMPDAHWGYGFPIGGVAAFDPDEGGVVSAGGVGFDISCGVRCLHTGLARADIEPVQAALAHELSRAIPAGVGSTGEIRLGEKEMDAMLAGGAAWAVQRGWGEPADLERIEERGQMQHAKPACVSAKAKKRQRDEMGTLGSGNHYLEVQEVTDVYDAPIAAAYGLAQGDIVLMIHCGSRGLGHQIGSEFLKRMAVSAAQRGIALPDRELACAPIRSEVGEEYLGAMRAAINCALANRQILTHLVREVFRRMLPRARLPLLYDVSHNTCKVEQHRVDGSRHELYVHRKGATRAFGPGHPDIPAAFRDAGQPVLIGGSMGTGSYVLAGTRESEALAFSSACHGAGRAMSRHQALKTWQGRRVVDELAARGILVKSPSLRGVAEEAPGAYKDVAAVVDAADAAGLARKVARVEPLVCIKG
ncbi:MAG: RtcB family protein [Betaproteobacteria bacterium]|nr:RtcB family protein [Betaproteobacteria bacterium]